MKAVRIEWFDSCVTSGWQNTPSKKHCKPPKCITVGMLLHDTKDFVTVVQSTSSSDHVDCFITIPHCVITEIRELV